MTNQLENSLRWFDEGDHMIPFEYYQPLKEYPNNEVLPHWHSGAEITIVHEGTANYLIDGQKIVSQAGDILFIPPNKLHTATNIKQTSETLVFHLNFIGLETHDYSAINYLKPLQNGKVQSIYRISKDVPHYPIIVELVRTIFAIIHERAPYFELKLKGSLLLLFNELFVADLLKFTIPKDSKALENQKIMKLLNYIDDNLDKPLKIQDLAKFSNYSPSHFMAFFRKNVGMTCIDYIQSLRIKKAEEYLRYSENTITDIALKVGFNSPSSFNRLFKAKRGLSPREYRRTWLADEV
ncbi:AraC family transcriptional regulator [Candidatus Enterococcus ferrettii]|uniref:HTH araC/xylS-type domain-containing protein n=1 Tax=Candidatus Enterococcus ferrettii TaxID=2815324 RepID=A0ABV0EX44_9ENTE|nr:AraC family transcriptional regulator [Enterococcus sp. 665A]MBO1340824.1 helix-turn-helix domain-containing protein [Enterococcus sp. 665A]